MLALDAVGLVPMVPTRLVGGVVTVVALVSLLTALAREMAAAKFENKFD